MNAQAGAQTRAVPFLLYDSGCATCTSIAHWVQKSASGRTGEPSIIARPVGNDPQELRRLNPSLDIWDAYAVSHVVMPDGSMRQGGEAVAEVLRRLPVTQWMAPWLDFSLLGIRPFQLLVNLAYHILDDIRPILGCDSCGRSKPWIRPIEWLKHWATTGDKKSDAPLHFRPLPAARPHSGSARASTESARFGIRIILDPLTLNRAATGPKEYHALRASAGLIVAEATEIAGQDQGYSGTSSPIDSQVAGWTKVTDALRAKGGEIIVQLWARGRAVNKSLDQSSADIASARSVSLEGMPGIAEALRHAWTDAIDAESRRVELPGAPRSAPHGGSTEERARRLIEVAKVCAVAIGADCLGVLISPIPADYDNPDSDSMP